MRLNSWIGSSISPVALVSIGMFLLALAGCTPSKVADATSADSADAVAWANVTGKPTSFTPSAHQHPGTDITSKVASATVADSANAVAWTGITGTPTSFPPAAHQHAGTDITSKVASATVADSANAVAWANITGTPTTFPPSSHTHSGADITSGVVNVNRLPYAQLLATGVCASVASEGATFAQTVPFTSASDTGNSLCAAATTANGTSCRFVVEVVGPTVYKTNNSCTATVGSVNPSTLFACCDHTANPCHTTEIQVGGTCADSTAYAAATWATASGECAVNGGNLCTMDELLGVQTSLDGCGRMEQCG